MRHPHPTTVADLRRRAWLARERLGHAFAALGHRLGLGWFVRIDYQPTALAAPRYGYGRPTHARLAALLDAHRHVFREQLERIAAFTDDLARITTSAPQPADPYWNNGFLPGLDGASLYGLVRAHAPARYLEVGSGNSTKFVVRAIRDGGLDTHVTSIDPAPRAEVDDLCDEVVRRPLEQADLALFGQLEAGDICFVDGSHRVFTNSDVVVFFLDVLPELPPGVIVGVHDVYLPDDYPASFTDRSFSEQYMLAAHLLAQGDRARPLLPAHYISTDAELAGILAPLWGRPALTGVERHGVGFWFVTT